MMVGVMAGNIIDLGCELSALDGGIAKGVLGTRYQN